MLSRLKLDPSVRIVLAACSLLALPRIAAAQECVETADCPMGFTCEVTGGSTCGAAPACPPGEDCPEPAPCESVEYRSCVPGPCESDADCADGMVCAEHTEGECTVSADVPCGPDGCDPLPTPPEEMCTERTVTQCAPKWALPCVEAADCGEGFRCVEYIEQWCDAGGAVAGGDPATTGGTGMGGASGFAPPPAEPPTDPDAPAQGGAAGSSGDVQPAPPEDPMCGETPTGQFYCEPEEISCEANTECPSGWLCKEQSTAPSGGCADVDPAPGQDPVPCPPPEPAPEVTKLCVPPYYDLAFPGRDANDSGGVASGEGSVTGGEPPANPTGPADPSPNPPTTSSPEGPGNGGTPTPADSEPAAQGASADGGGCQMGRGSTSTGAALLLGLAGAFGALRRRRRSA